MSSEQQDDESVAKILDTILFAEVYLLIYGFLGIAVAVMIWSKLYALFIQHDDVRLLYFVYFIVFSLNFFTNCTILTLRIFEQNLIILGFGSLIILFLNKFIFDVSTTIKSQKIWPKNVFISKHVTRWLASNEIPFTILSFFFGPIGSIFFVNSRLFIADIFLMGIPHSMIVHFIAGKLFWEVLLIQRLPELVIQCVYLALNGVDHFVVFGFLTTMLSLGVLIRLKLQLPQIAGLHKHWIHQTAFMIEVSGEEITNLTRAKQCSLQRNALLRGIATVIEIDAKLIELSVLQPIQVDIESHTAPKGESNLHRKRKSSSCAKCYGLKIVFSVNTSDMARRAIMMKLMEAREDYMLKYRIQKAWRLQKPPEVEDLVMMYNLFGHLVKSRVRNLDEPTITMTMTPNLMGIVSPTLATQRTTLSMVNTRPTIHENEAFASPVLTAEEAMVLSPSRAAMTMEMENDQDAQPNSNPDHNPYESFSVRY